MSFEQFLKEAVYDFSLDFSKYQIGRSKNNYIKIKKINTDKFIFQINDSGIQILSTEAVSKDEMLEKFSNYLTFSGDTIENTLKKLKYISGEDYIGIKK